MRHVDHLQRIITNIWASIYEIQEYIKDFTLVICQFSVCEMITVNVYISVYSIINEKAIRIL